MSYRPMMQTDTNEFSGNALRFATREEAEAYAQDLYSRWTMAVGWKVEESDDPVNYRWEDGALVYLDA